MLDDTATKLDCVATDLLGKSGRAMLDALVSGTTDPNLLAELARGQLQKKPPALRQALEGRFDSEHALAVGQILAHGVCDDRSARRCADQSAFAAALQFTLHRLRERAPADHRRRLPDEDAGARSGAKMAAASREQRLARGSLGVVREPARLERQVVGAVWAGGRQAAWADS
jgi:hypothetical protein